MTPAERLLAMIATDQGRQLAEKLVNDLRDVMHATHKLCNMLGLFVEASRPPYGEGVDLSKAQNVASQKDNDKGEAK